jgi:hypothetical protein
LTGEWVHLADCTPRLSLPAGELLSKFPVALLIESR